MLADLEGFVRLPFFEDDIRWKLLKRISIQLPLSWRSIGDGNSLLLSCRLINRLDDDHIPVALNAVRFNATMFLNSAGKSIDLRRKFIDHSEASLDVAFPDLTCEFPLLVEGKSWG